MVKYKKLVLNDKKLNDFFLKNIEPFQDSVSLRFAYFRFRRSLFRVFLPRMRLKYCSKIAQKYQAHLSVMIETGRSMRRKRKLMTEV